MSYQQLHIEELVTLCQKQNQKAQFEVYNRYCKAMYNVAFRIVKDEHFAEDVMQESFLKAFTKIDSYKKNVSKQKKSDTIDCYSRLTLLILNIIALVQ